MTTHFWYPRRLQVIGMGVALLLTLLMPAVSRAELINYFGNAMPGWSGTLPLSGSSLPTVAVEYAVFAPGSFNVAFGGGDPSGGTQFVYAYQLLNNAASPRAVTKFTVGLDPGAAPSGIMEMNDPNLPAGVGTSVVPALAPTMSPYTSAVWTFNTIGIGAKSEILLFTSPWDPKWLSGTVKGTSAIGESGNVPSPVPEPGTLLGLAIAGVLFILGRRDSFRRS
jgi:hypothetical protein